MNEDLLNRLRSSNLDVYDICRLVSAYQVCERVAKLEHVKISAPTWWSIVDDAREACCVVTTP